MAILEHLDQLCGQFPDCTAVAYADLATGMVLAARSAVKLPQEQIDLLGLTAVEVLTGRVAAAFAHPQAPGDLLLTALVIEDAAVALFLRSPAPATEVLCCECAARIDLPRFTRAARAVLMQMAAEG